MSRTCEAPGCDRTATTKKHGQHCPMHHYRAKHGIPFDQPKRDWTPGGKSKGQQWTRVLGPDVTAWPLFGPLSAPVVRECAECGLITTKRKFCSAKCRKRVEHRAYHARYPEKRKTRRRRRRALERGAYCDGHTAAELAESFEERGVHGCVFNGPNCTGACDAIDHVIPLARGGDNTISNLVPSCGPCNQSKHAKTPAEWLGSHCGGVW